MLLPRILIRIFLALLLLALPSYAQPAPAARTYSTQQAATIKPQIATMAAAQVPSVATPDFTGKTLDEVNALNVVPNVRARTALFSSVLPQGDAGGVVVSQSPAPKTPVYPGRSRLVITLAAKKPSVIDQIVGQIINPPERTTVPDVRDRTFADAARLLRAARLRPAITGDTSGLVAQQNPLPRSAVDPGSSVQLTFTPPQSVVPSLYGLELNAAQASLERAYLRPGAITGDRTSDIVSQSIQAGTQVPRGTMIDVAFRPTPAAPQPDAEPAIPQQPPATQPQPPDAVAVPQPPPQVFVPDLAKLSRERAIDTLTAVDLVALPSGPVKGLVSSQRPGAGEAVATGTPVSFTLTLPMVVVPSVIGDPQSNAQARLGVFGLVAAVRNSPDFKPGVAHFVVQQSPAANTEALVGATVTLTIGNAAAPPKPAWWQRLQVWVLPTAATLLGLLGFGSWKLTHRPVDTGGKTPQPPALPAQAFSLASRNAPSRIAAPQSPALRYTITLRDHRPAAGRYTITREPVIRSEPTLRRKG